MASAIATNVLRCEMAARTYIHDPADATVETAIAWVDMRDYENFMALVTFESGTGVLTFKIKASESSTGAGSPIEVKAHAAPTAPDAVNDQLALECSSNELAELGISTGVDLRYVCVYLDCDAAGDICAVTYIRAHPKYATAGLTPTSLIDSVATV
jgi:hypothetical protein